MEVWRSGWPLGGMPWGRLAFGVVDTPVAEALPYAGAVGVSFLLALSGALLAWLVSGPVAGEGSRKVAALCLVGLVALLAVPALAPWTAKADREITVAAVQGDVPGNGDDILYDYRAGHPEPRGRHGRPRPAGGGRRRPAAGPGRLAGELHGRRPLRRCGDQRRHPGRELGDRGPDPGRRDRRR